VLEALLDNGAVQDFVMPVPLTLALRSYQQEGLNWLAFLRRFSLGGALCDDMARLFG
jgi:TATA-binding protein-associated factor